MLEVRKTTGTTFEVRRCVYLSPGDKVSIEIEKDGADTTYDEYTVYEAGVYKLHVDLRKEEK